MAAQPRSPMAVAVERHENGRAKEQRGAQRSGSQCVPASIQFHCRKGFLMNDESLLSGWWVFAGVLLLVAGVLNIIYGIAAIGDSKFFTENVTYIISGLNTWGWIILILGV